MQVSAPVLTSAKAIHPVPLKVNLPTKDAATQQATQPDTAQQNSLTRLLASCCDCV